MINEKEEIIDMMLSIMWLMNCKILEKLLLLMASMMDTEPGQS